MEERHVNEFFRQQLIAGLVLGSGFGLLLVAALSWYIDMPSELWLLPLVLGLPVLALGARLCSRLGRAFLLRELRATWDQTFGNG